MRTESACLRAGAAHRLSKCFVSRERSATRRPTMAALHLVFKAASSGSRRCRRRPRTSKPGSGEPKSLRFSVKSPQALGGVRRGRGCTEYASREGPPSGAACATLCPLWKRKKVGQEWEGAGGRDEQGRGRALGSPRARASLGGASGGARRQRLRCKSILRSTTPSRPGSEAPPLCRRPRLLRAAAPERAALLKTRAGRDPALAWSARARREERFGTPGGARLRARSARRGAARLSAAAAAEQG